GAVSGKAEFTNRHLGPAAAIQPTQLIGRPDITTEPYRHLGQLLAARLPTDGLQQLRVINVYIDLLPAQRTVRYRIGPAAPTVLVVHSFNPAFAYCLPVTTSTTYAALQSAPRSRLAQNSGSHRKRPETRNGTR